MAVPLHVFFCCFPLYRHFWVWQHFDAATFVRALFLYTDFLKQCSKLRWQVGSALSWDCSKCWCGNALVAGLISSTPTCSHSVAITLQCCHVKVSLSWLLRGKRRTIAAALCKCFFYRQTSFLFYRAVCKEALEVHNCALTIDIFSLVGTTSLHFSFLYIPHWL